MSATAIVCWSLGAATLICVAAIAWGAAIVARAADEDLDPEA